jgi:hypothetical protein
LGSSGIKQAPGESDHFGSTLSMRHSRPKLSKKNGKTTGSAVEHRDERTVRRLSRREWVGLEGDVEDQRVGLVEQDSDDALDGVRIK